MHNLDGYSIHGTSRDIESENMFFAFDMDTADEFAGPLTRQFLDYIPEEWGSDVVIDSRSHMLKPGWYPAIPGWHLDNVPRGPDGQPVICDCEAEHITCIVEASDGETGSLTQFTPSERLPHLPSTLTDRRKQEGFQSLWHLHDHLINQSKPVVFHLRSGRPAMFGCRDYHRAIQATKPGWRWFIRASHKSGRKVENKIRQQVQVYLEQTEAGW